jgi:hypothetical protein
MPFALAVMTRLKRFALESAPLAVSLKNQFFRPTANVLLSPLEFVEKLASIIPPPYQHQVNYYGGLSSHSKMRPFIVPIKQVDVVPKERKSNKENPLDESLGDTQEEKAENPSTYIPWAELLKRPFHIDLTVCPCCGGRVRVIAAIIRKEAIQEILEHLNLLTGPPTKERLYETKNVYENFD